MILSHDQVSSRPIDYNSPHMSCLGISSMNSSGSESIGGR